MYSRKSKYWYLNILPENKNGKSYVKVTFYPDFARFKIKDLNNDHKELFERRTIDIAGVTNGKLKVYYNDKKIESNTFKQYVELYYNEENTVVQQIMKNKVITVCNAAVDDNSIAGYRKVSNNHNNTILEDYIGINKWQFNGAKSAEALTLLQLVYYIYYYNRNDNRLNNSFI